MPEITVRDIAYLALCVGMVTVGSLGAVGEISSNLLLIAALHVVLVAVAVDFGRQTALRRTVR